METKNIELGQGFLVANSHEVQFIVIFGSIILLFLIEGFIPRRTTEKNQTIRWFSNIFLALFNYFFIFFYSIALIVVLRYFQPESPLLQHFKVSDIPAFLIILLLMDFINYWVHRGFHRVPVLWRIHSVHHTDTEIDVTTSHRHHPIEPMLTVLILTPILMLVGAPAIVIVIYSLLHSLSSSFSHSNIVLPKKLDSVLRLFIITPDFHRMHHSSDKQYTDSNYSTLLSFYDYLFGTATRLPYEEIARMELGLETQREDKDSRIDRLLLAPFTYKRPQHNSSTS
jgi:sterol desaturase/sphingolipid hydroxylase (fatty acid hydroxylase superfamily)